MDRRTFSTTSIRMCAGALLVPLVAGRAFAEGVSDGSAPATSATAKSQEASNKAPGVKNQERASKSPGTNNSEAHSKTPGGRSQEQDAKAGGNKSMEESAKSQLPAPGNKVQQPKANGQGALYQPDEAERKRSLAMQHLVARGMV
jgi:hypothetical protein